MLEGEEAFIKAICAAVGVPVATAPLNASHQSFLKVPHSPCNEFGKVAKAKNDPAQNFL